MRFCLLAVTLVLAGCYADPLPSSAEDPSGSAERTEPAPLAPGTRPVRVGEQGPSFSACGIRGRVLPPANDDGVPVRAAPFEEAQKVGNLAQDQGLFVCTRSIDQRWLGIVAPPAGNPTEGCGVTVPVARQQAYAGSCLSGWIPFSAVRVGGL